ncbi:zinc finger translocation-associated protein isoform X2 [Astyanax mexicanus]|uniref:zinc finger translocation-associated protein isoform X2 n=1 Tax=Astyanax mexicanus TaxID=7994 RepID=UPI000BBD567F|nr:zinc finger translocation-associated protein isoform X2 [Astyanax mexicanus]
MEEEKEPQEPEPRRTAAHTQALSLIIRAVEGEATPGEPSAGEDDMTNGHIGDDGQVGLVTPGTSYWSISESPNSPFLLSPVPGPSGQKPTPAKPERASRPGHSRIPGRDHRRYYHEYWRSEYLMDFDPRRHGMICMVCGSSLATLKLSTIKRHIKQKHPDSLLWSASDKEVIRSGWESHLNLEKSQKPFCTDSAVATEPEETLDCAKLSTGKPISDETSKPRSRPRPKSKFKPQPQPQPEPELEPEHEPEPEPEPKVTKASASPPAPSVQEPQGPSAQILERYLNDSLHAWFRQEFLMEYQAEAGRLVCMVCSCPLPSLHLDHIKSHVLELHPDSLVYSSEEKHCILQTWAQTHESDSARDYFKSEPDTKDPTVDNTVQFFPSEMDPLPDHSEPYAGGEGEPPGAAQNPNMLPHQFPNRRLKNGCPWRLRLDYLVALGPSSSPGCYCMVCSEQLPLARVSSFRRHIQERHPETANLSRREREDIASAWTGEGDPEESAMQTEQATPIDITAGSLPANTQTPSTKPSKQSTIKTEDKERKVTPSTPHRQTHYPGKDQRRNYQVRWRMEYLMDYDCRRHGLICMVCGATLATLKVSTIKRHIQQVHPRSLDYSTEEKQQALQSYNQTALHFVHSDDCFSSSDHSHGAHASAKAEVEQTVCYST